MKQTVFLLLFVSFLGFFGVANAVTESLSETGVTVEMIPEIPGPNEIMTVSLTSYSTNINSANIIWKINGETKSFGVGEKSFQFTTKDLGLSTILDIIIKTQEGETIEKTYDIKPVSVDLVWESEGLVPPFYKGKSLFSHQNKITIIALPHLSLDNGVETGAKNLIYTWKRGGSVVDDASGYGKNTYSFVSPLISRTTTIEVEVTTLNGEATGYASITLTPNDPSVLFYKKDPLYGIKFQEAIQNTFALTDSNEITVVGIPLFFGTTNLNATELVYKWSINGVTINDYGQPIQVFRQTEGTSGTSKIGLSIENEKRILQYASNNFNLSFGNNEE